MLLMEVKPIFRYVYHVTSKANVPSIQQKGLLSYERSPSKQWQHITYGEPSIFVITRTSPEIISDLFGTMVAKNYEDLDSEDINWEQEMDNLVLLTIDLSKCSNIDLRQDSSSSAYQRWTQLTGNVPPESVVKIEPLRLYFKEF